MAVEGSLDLFSLPEILQMISQQGKTGILTIQGQQDIVAISFLAGDIVAADSLAHTVEEGLAKLLVSEGLLSAAELAGAGAEHKASGGRLLDLLVERQYLTRPQLLGALRLQTIRQLEALLRWQEGDFKRYGGDEVSYEEGFEPISVEHLLLRTLADLPRPAMCAQSGPPAGPAGAAVRPLRGTRISGGGAGERRSATPAKAGSGELWLPQVPELPELSTSTASLGTAPPAAFQPSQRPSPALAAPLPVGGPVATATAALAAAGAPAADRTEPPAVLAAPRLPATGAAPTVPAGGVAATAPAGGPAAAAGVDPVPWPAGALSSSPSAPPASDPVPWPAGVQSSSPSSSPGADPVPWPAAALSHPPSTPPARPRGSAAGVLKPLGASVAGGPPPPPAPRASPPGVLNPRGAWWAGGPPRPPAAGVLKPLSPPLAAGPTIASAATARPGTMRSPAGVAPGATSAGSAGSAGKSAVLPAVAGRRPSAVDAQALPGQGPRATAAGGPSPDGSPGGSLPKRYRQMQIERPDRLVPLAHRAVAAGLALAMAVALVAAARRAPDRVLLPFPWEQGERAAFERNQRESLYDKIEAAAKTALDRNGRFPDQLGQLRDSGLLSPADLADPGGEPLLYVAREDSYTLQATEAGRPLADADTIGAVSGNFLLDPTVLQSGPQNGPPIVLLD